MNGLRRAERLSGALRCLSSDPARRYAHSAWAAYMDSRVHAGERGKAWSAADFALGAAREADAYARLAADADPDSEAARDAGRFAAAAHSAADRALGRRTTRSRAEKWASAFTSAVAYVRYRDKSCGANEQGCIAGVMTGDGRRERVSVFS